jgi:hypothetical protein
MRNAQLNRFLGVFDLGRKQIAMLIADGGRVAFQVHPDPTIRFTRLPKSVFQPVVRLRKRD